MAGKKKRTTLKSLSQGRPPTVKNPRTISSKATRTLIRTHHTLEKLKAKALAEGDDAKAIILTKRIEEQGGIESYQQASLLGQARDRGGDSSKILMEWLKSTTPGLKELLSEGRAARMLEVGALSISNACSKSRFFDMERIDLNSQQDGIKQQDFMERPLPVNGEDKFDIISLSLVLNYVPEAARRGEMLRRTLKFLDHRQQHIGLQEIFPALFLVLPAPCVTNSRYLDERKLEAIMESLGYVQIQKKLSNKLVYYLWRMEPQVQHPALSFKKEEIRSGGSRNNFAIVVK